jgi:hypothetical protein
VPLPLDAYDSLFVVFRKAAGGKGVRDDGPNETAWEPVRGVEGPWRVRFDPKWGGPEQAVVFDELIDWTAHSDPAIRDYSGKAVYRSSFELGKDPAGRMAIELGEVRGVGIARVKVNGTDLGLAWRPPFRVEAGRALRRGLNELEVEVINSWHNRVLADSRLPASERLTRTNIRVERQGRFAWKPEPSGLIGPVRVVGSIQ